MSSGILTAPECPYCKKTTTRRRKYWRPWATVTCKTPGCGGSGEYAWIRHKPEWMWHDFSKVVKVERVTPLSATQTEPIPESAAG